MFIQLTDKDRMILQHEHTGEWYTKTVEPETDKLIEESVKPGKPFQTALVFDASQDTYLVIYANEDEVEENKWHLMWRDDRWGKALDYFTSYIADLEIERRSVDVYRDRQRALASDEAVPMADVAACDVILSRENA